jgi:ABC-type arginine transport system ATPase subunit
VLEKLKTVDPANDIQIKESPKHSSAGRFSHSNEPSKKRIFSNLHDQKKNLQPSLQNSTIPSTAAKPSTISPPHSGSLEKSQVTKKFAEEEISQEDIAHYSQLLNLKVGFTGKNLDVETRRYINCCRCLLKEPEIILFWEDSLNFGDGVEANLVRLFREANTSTILAITRNCKNVLAYDQVILMDNGTVAETGNPRLLMANNESILFSFVKETDPDSFKDVKKDLKYLKNKSECTSLTQSQHGDQTSMKSFNECAQNYRRPNRGNTYNRQAAEDFRRRNKSSLAAFKESNSRSFHIQQI